MKKKYKINKILFYDECIDIDKDRLIEICKRIKKLKEELPWEMKWSPQLTIHNMDDKILKILKILYPMKNLLFPITIRVELAFLCFIIKL